MVVISRILMVFIILFGCVYAVAVLLKHNLPSFFKCALFGIFCKLFAMLYYLALSTDSSLSELFTLGIFGELAQAMYVTAANAHYMPGTSENKPRFSIAGLLASLLIAGLYLGSVAFMSSPQEILCEVLYAAAFAPCTYFIVANMKNRREDAFRKAIFPFNLCIFLSFLVGCVCQYGVTISIATHNEPLFIFAFLIPCIIEAILHLLSVILLRKGLSPWEK